MTQSVITPNFQSIELLEKKFIEAHSYFSNLRYEIISKAIPVAITVDHYNCTVVYKYSEEITKALDEIDKMETAYFEEAYHVKFK